MTVDARHKLIVAFALTNAGHDSGQLYPRATQAKNERQVKRVTVVQTSGYSNGEMESKAANASKAALLPPAITSPNIKSLKSLAGSNQVMQGNLTARKKHCSLTGPS